MVAVPGGNSTAGEIIAVGGDETVLESPSSKFGTGRDWPFVGLEGVA